MKRRHWFALGRDERHVAATIVAVLLLGPLVLIGWPLLLAQIKVQDTWITVVMCVCFSLLTALLTGLVVSTIRHHRAGISLASLGHALMWFAGLQSLYGTWVLATGLTPGKHNVFSVPRTYSVSYFAWAALLVLIGLSAIAVGRRLRRGDT